MAQDSTTFQNPSQPVPTRTVPLEILRWSTRFLLDWMKKLALVEVFFVTAWRTASI
ncbi:MAG: hypothetical protein WBJ75_00465 [Pseudohongiellaceae bacterium]